MICAGFILKLALDGSFYIGIGYQTLDFDAFIEYWCC